MGTLVELLDVPPVDPIAPDPDPGPDPQFGKTSIPVLGFSDIVTSIKSLDPRTVVTRNATDPGEWDLANNLHFTSLTPGTLTINQTDPTNIKFSASGGGGTGASGPVDFRDAEAATTGNGGLFPVLNTQNWYWNLSTSISFPSFGTISDGYTFNIIFVQPIGGGCHVTFSPTDFAFAAGNSALGTAASQKTLITAVYWAAISRWYCSQPVIFVPGA